MRKSRLHRGASEGGEQARFQITDECIYCGSCEPVCPERAIAEDLEAGAYVIDPARCSGCPASERPPCVEACPVDAVVLRPLAPRPEPRHLHRCRGVLRAAGDARLLLAELALRQPPAPEHRHRLRAPCELELEGGTRLSLHCEEAVLHAPTREVRGPWRAVAPSPLAAWIVAGETRTPHGVIAPTPHSYLELSGPALEAGERVVVVGELVAHAFAEGGSFREAPRALPRAVRAEHVAAKEPGSLAALAAALEAQGIVTLDL